MKNNYVVKKIKEKRIESENQLTEKYLSQLHSLQGWKSITLDAEKTRSKAERLKFKPAYANFKNLDYNLHMPRAITTKYFS